MQFFNAHDGDEGPVQLSCPALSILDLKNMKLWMRIFLLTKTSNNTYS